VNDTLANLKASLEPTEIGQLDVASQAAIAFEARWTLAALKRVDPDLHAALLEQSAIYSQATMFGSAHDAAEHQKALARGYALAVSTMEASGAEDDAYMIGNHNGLMVAISHQKAVQQRVPHAIVLSPDEVALLCSVVKGMDKLAQIKQHWPGAELIGKYERYPDEPAKGDEE
jgi:predicted signal transduction protein with EAL and GGDEF domain